MGKKQNKKQKLKTQNLEWITQKLKNAQKHSKLKTKN